MQSTTPFTFIYIDDLARGFDRLCAWTRGVDHDLFNPARRVEELGFPRPIFLTVARIACEKNLAAFLALDLPGTKLVVGDGPGAQVRLRVLTQGWTGLGDGQGRLRACCAQVTADGRGEAVVTRTCWLWLPAEDGSVTAADPPGIPVPQDDGAARHLLGMTLPDLALPG